MLPEEFLKQEIVQAQHAFRALKIYFNDEITDEMINEMITDKNENLPYGLETISERRELLAYAKSLLNRNLIIPTSEI